MEVGKDKMKQGGFRGVSGNWYVGFSSKFNAITPLATKLYAVLEGLMGGGLQHSELGNRNKRPLHCQNAGKVG